MVRKIYGCHRNNYYDRLRYGRRDLFVLAKQTM